MTVWGLLLHSPVQAPDAPVDPNAYGQGGGGDATMTKHVDTPECDKLLEIVSSGRAQQVQDFLDWLLDEEKVQLYGEELFEDYDGNWQPAPYRKSREQIMAAFFGIDQDAVERERRAILAHLRSQDAERRVDQDLDQQNGEPR